MSSEEYYGAMQRQRQRELERRIRKTKREVAAMERKGIGLENPSYVQKRLVLGRQQRTIAAHCRDNGLTRLYAREKAYGVSSQPMALKNPPKKEHVYEQQISRNVSDEAVADAYARPLHIRETKYNSKGEPSNQYIGRDATIAVNPDTGKVVTVWPTSKRRRERYKENGNYGKTQHI